MKKNGLCFLSVIVLAFLCSCTAQTNAPKPAPSPAPRIVKHQPFKGACSTQKSEITVSFAKVDDGAEDHDSTALIKEVKKLAKAAGARRFTLAAGYTDYEFPLRKYTKEDTDAKAVVYQLHFLAEPEDKVINILDVLNNKGFIADAVVSPDNVNCDCVAQRPSLMIGIRDTQPTFGLIRKTVNQKTAEVKKIAKKAGVRKVSLQASNYILHAGESAMIEGQFSFRIEPASKLTEVMNALQGSSIQSAGVTGPAEEICLRQRTQ